LLVLNGIQTRFNDSEDQAIAIAVKKLHLSPARLKDAYVSKSSLDARNQQQMKKVNTVILHLHSQEEETSLAEKLPDNLVRYEPEPEFSITRGKLKRNGPIVIAGFGPAGMFAAGLLTRYGMPVIVLERGGPVEERVSAVEKFWREGILDSACNVQFGEGGAGTFSDGKLTTRINDPLCRYVLEQFAAHGAPPETLKKAKPHIGTDLLRKVVRSIREEILQNGGEIRFHSQLESISVTNGMLCGIRVNGADLPCSHLILAIGHSARDTFRMLANHGISMAPKPFSVGARIEHRQEWIDRGLYGKMAGHPALPPGEYQLSHRENGGAVYTFCMCPGGTVVPAASEIGQVVTNGMSEYSRNQQNANAALVVSVDSSDFGDGIFAGMEFQQALEQRAFQMSGQNYRGCGATVENFLEGKKGISLHRVEPSYALGIEAVDFDQLYPTRIAAMMRTGLRLFDRKIRGYAAPDAVLTGPETRTSSPIRILRGEDFSSVSAKGLYPCGEGAGYAGGIMSAAVDGLRVARYLLETYAE
jgi:uncharacterized FAD-dependent dehydrogenase